MMSSLRSVAWLVGLGLLVLVGAEARPQEAKGKERRVMLIQPNELQKELKRAELRLLDTRPQAEYAQGHIPGAVRVDVKSWQELGKKEGGFQDARAWGRKVSELGITTDSSIVVYGSTPTDTARIWWTLKYLGLPNVAILDGGWNRWVKEKRPSDDSILTVKATKFEPKFQADRLEEMESMKKAVRAGAVTVVDTRSAAEYTGKEVRGKRGGHIPGSTHLEWKELLAADGRYKSPEQLRALFRERGIKPEQTAVTLCQSGGRASVEAFALELAGYPKVKLFVRGWEQWSEDAEAPVEAK